MPNHNDIYKNKTQQYELLITREDYQHNIMKTIQRIAPHLGGVDVLDMGAGTGRLSCLLAPHVRSLIISDLSESMLERAMGNLTEIGATNWQAYVADNRSVPIANHSVDLVTAGWTICYSTNTHVEQWEENLELIMKELERVLRPLGTVVIFENFGSGDEQPNPPDYLLSYYDALVNKYDFSHEYIRTDSQFESIEEAEQLFRFFFGDEFADRVRTSGQTIVPACTGIWWKRYGS